MKTAITNGKILTPQGWKEGVLIIEDSKIAGIAHGAPADAQIIDAHRGYVLPGGIDLHVHGGGGRDFQEADREAFETAIATHRRHGTTAILPTLSSSDSETMRRAAAIADDMMADPYSGVIGLHFEGPYFSHTYGGAQMPQYIRNPDPEEYRAIVEAHPSVRRWDAAPEQPGAMEFARYLRSKGVVCALAHTGAEDDTIEEAEKAGFTLATHFFNGMSNAHKDGMYKHSGVVESVFMRDNIATEVIADGIHVPAVMLRLLHKIKGTDKVALVTDCLACAESADGKAFDPRVVVGDGVAMLSDGSAIAGSIATMDRLIRTMTQAGIPLEEVSAMASATPAKIMGIYDHKGSLEAGKDADIIIMDPDLNLTKVIAMGRPVDNA